MAKNKQGKKSARQQLNEDLVARPGGAIGKSRKQARKNEKEEAIMDGLDALEEDYGSIMEAFYDDYQ